jgi:hypothetical protein
MEALYYSRRYAEAFYAKVNGYGGAKKYYACPSGCCYGRCLGELRDTKASAIIMELGFPDYREDTHQVVQHLHGPPGAEAGGSYE